MVCMCTLAGTAACKTCQNNPDSIFVTGTTIVTNVPQIIYVPERTCRPARTDCFECDECGFLDAYAAPDSFNYCPNCGAKVVSE